MCCCYNEACVVSLRTSGIMVFAPCSYKLPTNRQLPEVGVNITFLFSVPNCNRWLVFSIRLPQPQIPITHKSGFVQLKLDVSRLMLEASCVHIDRSGWSNLAVFEQCKFFLLP